MQALHLQCRSLSLFCIGTINYFGNSFQLIKTVPDRDCWSSEFPLNVLASFPIFGLLQASSENWGFLEENYLPSVFIFVFCFFVLFSPRFPSLWPLTLINCEDHRLLVSYPCCLVSLFFLSFSLQQKWIRLFCANGHLQVSLTVC